MKSGSVHAQLRLKKRQTLQIARVPLPYTSNAASLFENTHAKIQEMMDAKIVKFFGEWPVSKRRMCPENMRLFF
jgi:hypothetical protein